MAGTIQCPARKKVPIGTMSVPPDTFGDRRSGRAAAIQRLLRRRTSCFGGPIFQAGCAASGRKRVPELISLLNGNHHIFVQRVRCN